MKINRTKMELAMLNKGWNFSALAEASGVSRATVSAIRNGKSPAPGTFLKLAAALGVSPAELVEEVKA